MAQSVWTREVTAAQATAGARLRRAARGFRLPWAMLQVLLLAVTAAITALWLELPDRTAAETTISLSVAISGVLGFLWAESYILTLVRRRGGDRAALWKGALLLAGLGVLYTVVTTIFDVGEMRDVTRAAWWSLEPRVNSVVSADVLLLLEGALWSTLRGLVLTALLPFAMEGAATGMRGRWMRRAAWLWLEPTYWAVVLGCAATGTVVTQGLLHLRPHVGIVAEVLLTVFKVLTIVAIDVGALCFALSWTGTFLRDAQLVMPVSPQALRPGREPAGREAHPSSGRHQRQ